MARGIRDSVAILGMGCSKFGERWHDGPEDLLVEAFQECLEDAGVGRDRIDAAWLATAIEEVSVGKSGIPLAEALRLPYIPVTRVENFCASGTESFRGAVYAVASGAADIALAAGVEKLKDTGYGGLPQRSRGALNDMVWANFSAPGSFAQLAAAYRARHSVSPEDLKRAMAQVSVKSHANGAKNPKAHLRNEISIDKAVKRADGGRSPRALRLLRGVRRRRVRHRVPPRDRPGARPRESDHGQGPAGLGFQRERGRAQLLGRQPLRHRPHREPSRLRGGGSARSACGGGHGGSARLLLHHRAGDDGRPRPVAGRRGGGRDVLDGVYDAEGDTPCQIDGGLKCFGHPIGASGLRMLYEVYLQLEGRAGERQLDAPRLGLTHNLGGAPHRNVCSVAIVGREGG